MNNKKTKSYKVFIAVKVQNVPYNEILQNFARSENLLKKLGYEVVNPIISGSLLSDMDSIKRQFLPYLFKCNAIYLNDGWQFCEYASISKIIGDMLHLHDVKDDVIEQVKKIVNSN